MASAEFIQCLPFVLKWEGGYVNHPADPGGATNQGVTQKVYDTWRSRNGQLPRSVKELTEAEMQAIYEGGYWLPPRCDRLRDALDLVQFDTAVNMGVGRAVRFLQTAVGAAADGDYGPQMAVFLKGWLNRLNALRKEAGLPGFEADVELDLGDTGHIAKVPDLGEDESFDRI